MGELAKTEENKIALKEQWKVENTIPKSIIRYANVKNALTAYSAKSIPLALIRKKFGVEFQLNYINMWLLDLNKFVNAKYKMDENQIIQTAEMIASTYYYFKISEFYFALKCIKMGIRGKLYESLDGMKVMEWLQQYDNERLANLPTISDPNHDINNETNKQFFSKYYGVDSEGRIIRKKQKDKKPEINVYAEMVVKANEKKIQKDLNTIKKEVEFKEFQKEYNSKKNDKN